MTVYVVLTAYDNDTPEVVAVFATRDAAEAYAATWGDDYHLTVFIKEWQVQTAHGGLTVKQS